MVDHARNVHLPWPKMYSIHLTMITIVVGRTVIYNAVFVEHGVRPTFLWLSSYVTSSHVLRPQGVCLLTWHMSFQPLSGLKNTSLSLIKFHRLCFNLKDNLLIKIQSNSKKIIDLFLN